MILEENQILKNQAFIGGGINYEGIIPTLSDNIVENNSALLYGQNIFSYPTRLNLENSLELEQLNNQIQIKTNKIIISKQRSGGSLPMMIFTLKNEYNDIMKFADTEEIQNTYIILEIDSQIQYYEQYYLRGEPKAYYNQQTNNFQFKNIDLIGKPQSKVKLMVKSSLIRDNNTKQLTNNYYFEILVEILDCQKGQIKYKYNGFQECKICEQGTYSFDYNQCYKCPNGADCLGGSQIVVDQGFWRREEYDDNILSCENLKENCQGGSFGNLICYRGHIGALCEECDINGVFWGESYTKSGKYTCTECKKIQFNMYIVVFVTLWTMVSMVISVKSDSKKQTEIYKQELFSRIASKSTLKTKNQNKNNVDEYTSVYIKIFTNYLQIISSMASFNLKVPSGVIEFSSTVGQPLQKTMNSLDCALKEIKTTIPIIYLRLLFSLILPLVYLITFIVGIFIYYKLMKKTRKFPFYLIYTAIIFLFIYTQPDLVSQMIALISCRQIGNTKYILSNVSFECYTDDFYKWGLGLILPFLFVFVIFFPYVLFFLLRRSKNSLQTLEIKKKYGFLYKEYTQKCYYWEFIKMAQKLSIILSLNFYSQDIKTKGILVFITITIYSIALILTKPYKSSDINKLDRYSTNVCSISVLLGVFIYQNDFYYLVIISFIVIVIINSLFTLIILKNIILGYTQKIKNILSKIFEKISGKIKIFQRFQQNKTESIVQEQDQTKQQQIKQKIKKILLNLKSLSTQQRMNLAIKVYTEMIQKRCNYNREQQLQQSQLIINNVTPNSDINLNGNQDTNHNQQLVITNPITSPGIELGLEKNVLLSAKRLLTDQIQSQNEEDYNQEFEERKEQDQCFSFRKYK